MEGNGKSRVDDSDPLCERVVREDTMDDEEEKDQYRHATSYNTQEPFCPSISRTKRGGIQDQVLY